MSSLESEYRSDVQILRAISILLVILYHYFPAYLPAGFVGVDIFFVISGFVITGSLKRKGAELTLGSFYFNRFKRLSGPLALVLIVVSLFGYFLLYLDEFKNLLAHSVYSFGFFENLSRMGKGEYFSVDAIKNPTLHLWSLGVEAQFYLLYPLVFIFFRTTNNQLLAVCTLAGVSICGAILSSVFGSSLNFYNPLSRFWEFCFGGLISLGEFGSSRGYALFAAHPQSKVVGLSLIYRWIVNQLSYIRILCLVGIIIVSMFPLGTENWPTALALIPVLLTSVLLMTGFRIPTWTSRIMTPIGDNSYSIYLWHWPLLSISTVYLCGFPSAYSRVMLIVLAISLGFGTEIIWRRVRKKANYILPIFAVYLSGALFTLAALYYFTHVYAVNKKPLMERVCSDDIIGTSNRFYWGKDEYLFLGNEYDQSVSKARSSITPNQRDIDNFKANLSLLNDEALRHNVRMVVLIAPNKESVYSDKLPYIRDGSRSYIDPYLRGVRAAGIEIYFPLGFMKEYRQVYSELYYRHDSHWNPIGAYAAYRYLMETLRLPMAYPEFVNAAPRIGDIARLTSQESQIPTIDREVIATFLDGSITQMEEEVLYDYPVTPFGYSSIVRNPMPLISDRAWVVGDSFTLEMKRYFNKTFSEVRYLNSLHNNMKLATEELSKLEHKPKYIFIVKVERALK